MGTVHSLEEGDQLVVKHGDGSTEVIDGPGRPMTGPLSDGTILKATVLEPRQFCRIRHRLTGKWRTVRGPGKVMIRPYEEKGRVLSATVLEANQFCRVQNRKTGSLKAWPGPCVVELEEFDEIVGGVQNCPVLKHSEACRLLDKQTGERRTVCGPAIVQLDAYEEVLPVGGSEIWSLPSLGNAEYCKITNSESGETRIVVGPAVVELGAYDEITVQCRKLPVLQRGEYCKIQNQIDGSLRIAFGPAVVELDAYEETVEGTQRCIDLSGEEYLTVRDESSGDLRNVVGPMLFMPNPFDSFGQPKKVVNLQKNEYIKIRDNKGVVRVKRGECKLVPGPLDFLMHEKKKAVNVDAHNAVLVLNTDTAKQELVTEHGLFFPSPLQQIVEVREKIVLEKYQTVVCQDESGKFYFASGNTDLPDEERGPGPDFFLPPYHSVLKQSWSTDLRKEHATAEDVWLFDSRPSYMNYEFECRTLDNVALIVDVTFFWAVVDLKAMIKATADAPGDVCTHARSTIMQKISQIKLMDFLSSFNEVIKEACLGDSFYVERGVDLRSVEVLKFNCENPQTDMILQEIIRETCDRMKLKERQRGLNEVALEKLDNEIKEEIKKADLIEVKKSHLKVEAKIEGEARGLKIGEFIGHLADASVAGSSFGVDRALTIYRSMLKYENHLKANQALSQGTNSTLYLEPDAVGLKGLGSKEAKE